MALPPDIIARIKQEFGARSAEATNVLQSRSAIATETGRVLRCIVFLAEGDLGRLAQLAEHASTDYRDVIFWAEYVNHEAASPRRVRDFNRQFGTQGREHDTRTPRLPADVRRFFDRQRAARRKSR
jgi:hypothetical protein